MENRTVVRDEVRTLLQADPRRPPIPTWLWNGIAERGALLRGHFALQSGLHSEYFLRFSALGQDRALTEKIAQFLVDTSPFKAHGAAILCSEAAGMFLGSSVAAILKSRLVVTQIDLSRRPANRFRLGYLSEGESVLVVNDVLASGESIRRLLDRVAASRAAVCGVFGFAAVGAPSTAELLDNRSIRANWLLNSTWPTYTAEDCPICGDHGPLIPASELT